MHTLYMDKVKGLITESDYIEFTKDISNDRKRFESQLTESERTLATIDEKLKNSSSRKALLEKYIHMEHLSREAVEILIDKIVIAKRDKKTNVQKIEIFWNF